MIKNKPKYYYQKNMNHKMRIICFYLYHHYTVYICKNREIYYPDELIFIYLSSDIIIYSNFFSIIFFFKINYNKLK